jgi:hypothetical protein
MSLVVVGRVQAVGLVIATFGVETTVAMLQ